MNPRHLDQTIAEVADRIRDLQDLLNRLHAFKNNLGNSPGTTPIVPRGTRGPVRGRRSAIPLVKRRHRRNVDENGSSARSESVNLPGSIQEQLAAPHTNQQGPTLAAALPGKVAGTCGVDPTKLTPYSPRAISEIAPKLKVEFTMDDLGALLPGGKQAAYYWSAQWRNRNWIEKLDYDQFRKTAKFGK